MPKYTPGKVAWAWKGKKNLFFSAIIDPTRTKSAGQVVREYMAPDKELLTTIGREIISAYRGGPSHTYLFIDKKAQVIRDGRYKVGLKNRRSPSGRPFKTLAPLTLLLRKEKKKAGIIPQARSGRFILRETDRHLYNRIQILSLYGGKRSKVVVGWDDPEIARIAQFHQTGGTVKVDYESKDFLAKKFAAQLKSLESVLAVSNIPVADLKAIRLFREKLVSLARLRTAIRKGESSFTYNKESFPLVPTTASVTRKVPMMYRGRRLGYKRVKVEGQLSALMTKRIQNILRAMGFQRTRYMQKELQQYATGKISSADIWSGKRMMVFYSRYGYKKGGVRYERPEAAAFYPHMTKVWKAYYSHPIGESIIYEKAGIAIENFTKSFIEDQEKLLRRYGIKIGIDYKKSTDALESMLNTATLSAEEQVELMAQPHMRATARIGAPKKYKPTYSIIVNIPSRPHYGFSRQLNSQLVKIGRAWISRSV